ncbi:hypothetical protein CAL7716_100070 (plasmid) [Calothrix sp. PCC 7716]|nr:hypothetical protein CAL7716_100070 [Calothrix sp. PCC 7716]
MGTNLLLSTLLVDLGKVKNNLKNFTITVGIKVDVLAPTPVAATEVAVNKAMDVVMDAGYEIDYEATFGKHLNRNQSRQNGVI